MWCSDSKNNLNEGVPRGAYARSGNTDVFYTDTGGPGPALVLAHGFLMDSRMFAKQVAALAGQMRIVAWDARGHGQTRDDGNSFTYWDLAADTFAVMDAAGLAHAYVGGMSQGGFSALRAALIEPVRVDGPILIGTAAAACSPEDVAAYGELFAAWFSDEPLAPVVEGVAVQLIGGTDADRAPWTAQWLASDRDRILNAAACLVERDDVTARLGEIACPALVIRGGHDQGIARTASEALCAGLANAGCLLEVSGAGHAVNWIHPEPVNTAIAAFLESFDRRPQSVF